MPAVAERGDKGGGRAGGRQIGGQQGFRCPRCKQIYDVLHQSGHCEIEQDEMEQDEMVGT